MYSSERGKKKFSSRYWRNVLNKGGISKEEIDILKNIDPSPTKKYMDFLVKVWLNEKPDLNIIKSLIEEFHVLSENHRIEKVDINTFTTLDSLSQFVDKENEKASASTREMENDYEIIRNDSDLLIAIPYTHQASRKLGLMYFGTRQDNTCSWCTTYKNASHFDSYFYSSGVTFYYIKVKNSQLISSISSKYDLQHVAILVHSNGKIEGYDGNDKLINTSILNKFRKAIGI